MERKVEISKGIEISKIAICLTIIVVTAQISFPLFSLPFTLQTFGVALCGYLLKWKRGSFCVIAYIFLGFCGLPVFSRFQNGMGVLASGTLGYVMGFLPLVISTGIDFKNNLSKIGFSLFGLIVCHIMGISWLYFVSGKVTFAPFVVASLILFVKDGAMLFLAEVVSKKSNKISR